MSEGTAPLDGASESYPIVGDAELKRLMDARKAEYAAQRAASGQPRRRAPTAANLAAVAAVVDQIGEDRRRLSEMYRAIRKHKQP